jgi:hypothetical protein
VSFTSGLTVICEEQSVYVIFAAWRVLFRECLFLRRFCVEILQELFCSDRRKIRLSALSASAKFLFLDVIFNF